MVTHLTEKEKNKHSYTTRVIQIATKWIAFALYVQRYTHKLRSICNRYSPEFATSRFPSRRNSELRRKTDSGFPEGPPLFEFAYVNKYSCPSKKRLKASFVDIPHCYAVLSGLKGKGRLSFLSAGDRNAAQNITHSPVRRPARGNFIIEHPIPIIRYRRAHGTLALCPSDCYP